jgi:glutamate dehydrogenase (NAD(P)+)
MPGTNALSNAELLALECDILLPAALEAQIRADNVEAVRARFVVEAANGPTTPAADRVLFRRGIPALPDILANSGGVTVSYFEWVQNIENQRLGRGRGQRQAHQNGAGHGRGARPASDLNEAIRGGVLQGGEPADLRTAALVLAVERVAAVTLERGLWP